MNGVDTNVLLRLIVRDDPEQTAGADAFMDANCTRESPCFVNRIVLCEAAWVMRRVYGYDRDVIADVIEKILGSAALVVEDREEAQQALSAFRGSRAGFSDCFVGKTNAAAGCGGTVTFDRLAARLPEFEQLPAG